MLKSKSLIMIISLGCVLLLSTCSRTEKSPPSTEKIPITTNSKSALADYYRGLAFANKLQQEQAKACFLKAVESDPTFATAWLSLALVSAGINDFLSALDSAKAHSAHISEAEKLNIAAVEYGLLAMNIEQSETLHKIVSLYPGDERAHINLGNYLFGSQLYREAIQSYTAAININDELAAPYNMLGYSQRALGNYGEAEKAFKRYIKLNSNNPNAYDSYAELLLEMGRYRESIEYYRQALALDSTFVASYLGIASNYNFLGESENARLELEKGRLVAPNYIVLRQTIFAEAVSYVCEGKFDQALLMFDLSRKIAEENGDFANIANDYVTMANIYLELGKVDTALTLYDQAMQVIDESDLQMGIKDNAHTVDLYNDARAHAAQGDYRLAKREAEDFSNIATAMKNPGQIRLSHQLNGLIALHEKKYALAIDQFEQSNQLNPQNLYRIGLAYEGLGDSEMARAMFQRARELNILNSMDQAWVLWKTRDLAVAPD
ncbi:MAG: tetratricopeptide repeat protein [Candidatus Marinimicrobia bacterium]|nr:tetratricopeptide repeat protein [Candidatus Neomarinimicrobiota bacterium]